MSKEGETVGEKSSETVMGSTPIYVQSESAFNAGLILTESNYDVWSQIMEMHITEREKLSYINGKKVSPEKEDGGYEKWQSENQKVKRWLLMSMSPDIMKRYLRLPTAREVWSALKKAFSDDKDELQVFTLNRQAFAAKQNGRPLSVYYGELTEIFQELNHRDKTKMKDPDDVLEYKKSVDRLRVHIFLAGLDGDFEQICREILRKDSTTDIEECYSIVRREAARQSTFTSTIQDASALVTKHRPNYPRSENNMGRSNLKCFHCQKTGHTKNKCYELVGYPEWWDHTRKTQRVSSNIASGGTKREDTSTNQPSAYVMTPCSEGKVFNASISSTHNTWIIDSGATDHMTFDSRHMSPLRSSNQKFVSTANGDSASVIGEGSLPLTDTINLNSVLVVPSLDNNLLSISQITANLSCVVIFWPDYCVFKDINTGETIGCGIRKGKLYYLDMESKGIESLRQALAVGVDQKEKRKKKSGYGIVVSGMPLLDI